ncbi:hypothetical protein Q5X66_06265 [Acinetobacter baumannii]|nr:hypothetical protein [Acinetobacter baumannii]
MDIGDIISGISCLVAIISAFLAYRFSSKSNHYSQESLRASQDSAKTSSAQLETSLRAEIRTATTECQSAGNAITNFLAMIEGDLNERQKQHLMVLQKSWHTSTENYLNACEDACGKYLDDKVDKVRFKKNYINELRNICDHKNEQYYRVMHPRDNSHYKAIWKVYKEWYDLEQ